MKTNIQPRTVSASTNSSQNFTIKANGKAFKILIDGLYANKIQSIVREIFSNALDSHIAKGCADTEFKVTMPSVFDATFSVRDYGTSLSHDNVMHLYSTVFESTKEDTNAAVGKFGLGSKSPFAYTDTFTVTAYMDGEVRMYTALISEDGTPQIHALFDPDAVPSTTEPNGIEVSFPVATKDIKAFMTAAERVCHGFDVKPVVATDADNGEEFAGWPELGVLSEGDGWKLLEGPLEGYTRKAYAKMGCVLYPIDVEALPALSPEEARLLKSAMIIDFPVGALEVNASREALSYGPKDPTEDAIMKRLRTIVDSMVKSFSDKYEAAGSFWEACVLHRLHTHSGASEIPQAVLTRLKDVADFKGKKLINSVTLTSSPKTSGTKTDKIHLVTGLTATMFGEYKLTAASNLKYNYGSVIETVYPQDKTCVFVEYTEGAQVTKRAAVKIKTKAGEDSYTQVLWVKCADDKAAKAQLRVLLKDKMSGIPVVYVHTLPEPAKAESTRVYRNVQARVMRNYSGSFDTSVSMTDQDIEDGGFFVPLERMRPQHPSTTAYPREMWESLIAAGAVPAGTKLYGAPKTLWKDFEGEQWVNIYEYAEEWIKNRKYKEALIAARRNKSIMGNIELRYLHKRLGDTFEKEFVAGSLAKIAVDVYAAESAAQKPASRGLVDLAVCLGHTGPSEELVEKEVAEFTAMSVALREQYPLMKYFDTYAVTDSVDMVLKYVNTCDKAALFDATQNTTNAATVAA